MLPAIYKIVSLCSAFVVRCYACLLIEFCLRFFFFFLGFGFLLLSKIWNTNFIQKIFFRYNFFIYWNFPKIPIITSFSADFYNRFVSPKFYFYFSPKFSSHANYCNCFVLEISNFWHCKAIFLLFHFYKLNRSIFSYQIVLSSVFLLMRRKQLMKEFTFTHVCLILSECSRWKIIMIIWLATPIITPIFSYPHKVRLYDCLRCPSSYTVNIILDSNFGPTVSSMLS